MAAQGSEAGVVLKGQGSVVGADAVHAVRLAGGEGVIVRLSTADDVDAAGVALVSVDPVAIQSEQDVGHARAAVPEAHRATNVVHRVDLEGASGGLGRDGAIVQRDIGELQGGAGAR